MYEDLLKNILSGTISAETVIKWIKNEDIEEKCSTLKEYSQGEFILYFLNYLHEETSGILHTFSNQTTPMRIRTPRRIDTSSIKSKKDQNMKKINTRRTALFPDKQNDPNLGVSLLESESRLSVSTSTPRSNKTRNSYEKQGSDSSIHLMSPISPACRSNRSDFRNKSLTPKSGLCLGDFIVPKKSSVKKKLHSKLNESNSSLEQSDTNKPNIENCLNLSNIDKVSDNKNIRRINLNHSMKSNSFESSSEQFLDDDSKSINIRRINLSHSATKDKSNLEDAKSKFSQSISNLGNTSDKVLEDNSKLKISRRINPTSLTNDNNFRRLTTNTNNFVFKDAEILETSQDSRDILREERLKILSQSKATNINNFETRNRAQSLTFIQPNLESVTFRYELDIIIDIYSTLFDLNLLVNTLSELYFLLSLILLQVENLYVHPDLEIEELRDTLKKSLTDLTDDYLMEHLFKTVHNCVYFAANVLNKQIRLLGTLDRTSLKLLYENSRLRVFVPNLTRKLVVFHGKKIEKKCENYSSGDSGGENVSFISETDNRENFTSDPSFHAFRKQRDLFYEVLRLWETNHMQENFHFASALTQKIRILITMHSDPINSMHLARLFKNQLLAECNSQSSSSAADLIPLPTCLNGIDAEKLCRLRDRFVSRKSSGGPSPEPSFPGRQEFYRDFILVANSSIFHRHLIDCITVDILQLDDTATWPSDIEDSDSMIDSSIKSLYVNSIKSLKLLAKFLGFLEALPYKTDLMPKHQILTTQIAIRKYYVPIIDVTHHISEAIQIGKLILTLPWLVDYVAMLDHTTLRLPYFVKFIEQLYEIHFHIGENFRFSKQLECVLMIKLCLGWLFERLNFPLDTYQYWITKKYQQKLQNIYEISSKKNMNFNSSIDHLNLVDEAIIFICCPYFIEIKNILSSDTNLFSNKNGGVKYIRPISTVEDRTDVTKKKLQKQLEEAFFHSQPASTRKTIDLVNERVASACVKNICNNLVPQAKLKFAEIFKTHLTHITLPSDDDIRNEISQCCTKYADELSRKCFEEFRKTCHDEIDQAVKIRCENSLKALLSDDVHDIARLTCVSIAIQQSKGRIEQWFIAHVNPGIFLKEFVSEMENLKHNGRQSSKKLTYHLPAKGRNVVHDPAAKSPVTLLTNIRELMYMLHEQPHQIQIDLIKDLLNDSIETCKNRCDLNPIAQNMINKMFFDMFFMLAAGRPDLALNPQYLDDLLLFWTNYLDGKEKETFFNRILCARNATLFEQSTNPSQTWQACCLLLQKLIHEGLLKTEQFGTQAIAMFRYNWNPNTIKYFTKCVQDVIDDYIQRTGSSENFTFILSWIADYCNDEEFF